MEDPVTLATLGTHDTGRRQQKTKQNKTKTKQKQTNKKQNQTNKPKINRTKK